MATYETIQAFLGGAGKELTCNDILFVFLVRLALARIGKYLPILASADCRFENSFITMAIMTNTSAIKPALMACKHVKFHFHQKVLTGDVHQCRAWCTITGKDLEFLKYVAINVIIINKVVFTKAFYVTVYCLT